MSLGVATGTAISAHPNKMGESRATPRAEPRPSGPWLDNNYFHVISNLVFFDQPIPARSGPLDDVAGPVRPLKRPRTHSTTNTGEDADYIVLSRCTIVDKKSLSDDVKPPTKHQPLKRHPVDKYFSFRRNDECGVDLVAALPLKTGVKVPAKQSFGFRSLLDEEQFIVSMHKKASSIADSPICVRLFATVDYDTSSSTVKLSLDLELRWIMQPHLQVRSLQERTLAEYIMARYFPDIPQRTSTMRRHGERNNNEFVDWTPRAFYEAAHVTSKTDGESDNIHVPGLTADLFPFQRRAVKWLLKREGVSWLPNSTNGSPIVPYTFPPEPGLTSHFVSKNDADGKTFYISGLLGAVTRDPYSFQQANDDTCRGGILSEEMGLGKTVEMISLILLHPPPAIELLNLGHIENPKLGGTLIIAPSALMSQWIDEITRHAPHLKLMVYKGMKSSCTTKEDEESIVEEFCKHDVVIATYTSLRSEIHFAVSPPDRKSVV